MKKIRKWFFKLLTGYDLVEYEDVMREWKATLDNAKRIANINDRLVKNSVEIMDLLDSYFNEEVK